MSTAVLPAIAPTLVHNVYRDMFQSSFVKIALGARKTREASGDGKGISGSRKPGWVAKNMRPHVMRTKSPSANFLPAERLTSLVPHQGWAWVNDDFLFCA